MSVKRKFGIVLLVILGLFVALFVAAGISLALETDEEREEREQRSIEKRQIEFARQEQEKAKQLLEQKQQESKWDPEIVASAKKNLPKMMSLPNELLKECLLVVTDDDFEIYAIALLVNKEEITNVMIQMNDAILDLEVRGYDKHPEIGPLIAKNKLKMKQVQDCVFNLQERFG